MPAMTGTKYYGIGPNGAKPNSLMVIESSGRNVWVLNRRDHVWEERPDAVRYLFDAGAVSPDVLTEIDAATSAALAAEFSSPPWGVTAALEFGEGPGHPFRGNQWTDGESGSGADWSGGKGTMEDPFRVSSAEKAVKLIEQGHFVRLPPKQISIAIDKLHEMAQDAKAKSADGKAPVYNLCQISVPDTNLFCADNQGIDRLHMPQLGGMNPEKGTIADSWERDAKGEVNGAEQFKAALAADGIKLTEETVPAVYLKATQNELNGDKVGGMMRSIEKSEAPGATKAEKDRGEFVRDMRIFVSNDNYVLDGHHRWAAVVGSDYTDGKGGDINMNVVKIDMPISELLPYTNAWTEEVGLAHAAV